MLIKKTIQYIKNRLLHYKGPDPLKVIITGPPRSGTSFLAGFVANMGFSPGPTEWLKKGNHNNPYGYYECMPLMEIDHNLLKVLGGSVMDPPELMENWTKSCDKEKKQIYKIIQNGGIEIYKGNMLVILADLYSELFPNAKWIMIYRNEADTIRSIMNTGTAMEPQELAIIRKRWLQGWENSRASSDCLTIKYEDFTDDPKRMVSVISDYLGIKLAEKRFRKCVAFFRPRQTGE